MYVCKKQHKMKCKIYITVFKLLVLLLSLLFLSGCGIMKKTKTIIRTETIIKVDTVVRVAIDTIVKINVGLITDTVFIENKVAVARSYINHVTGKIHLELTGKTFDVPVKISKRIVEQKREITKQFPALKGFIFGAIYIVLVFLAAYFITKYRNV